MTGRDVPTQEKALSVALSVIMVLSVMAIGMAGFAGSAAAESPTQGNVTFAATPADGDATNAAHVFTYRVNATNDGAVVSGGGGEQIAITYADGNIDTSGIGLRQTEVQLIEPDSQTVTNLTVGGGAGNDIAAVNTGTTVTITLDTGDTGADVDQTIEAGDYIRISLGNQTTGVDQSAIGNDTSANVQLTSGNFTDQTLTADLQLGSNAPIKVSASGGDDNHYSLEEAISDAGANTDKITLSDTVSEFTSQPGKVQAIDSAIHDDGDIIVEGNGNTVEATSDDLVDLNGQNNVTYNNLNINASDSLSSSIQAIKDTTGPANGTTITDNTFTNFTGSDVIDIGSNTRLSNLTLTDNILNVGNSNGIAVDAHLEGQVDQFLAIENNEITTTSGNNGLDLDIDNGNGGINDDVTISGNDIAGDGSNGGTGITLAGDYNLSINDGSIDNVQTGIDLGTGSQSAINITGTDFTNITDAGASSETGIDANGSLGGSTQILIDSVTFDDSPNVNPAISVDDNAQDIEITSSSINNTQTGILIAEVSDNAIISDTSVTNTGAKAIDINDPGATDNVATVANNSVSIDQAGTGVEIDASTSPQTVDVENVDINSTSRGVNINGLVDNQNVAVNVTDSTFTNNNVAGLNFSDPGAAIQDTRVNVHFNTFEQNDVGIGVDDGANNFNGVLNATFNNFIDNANAGLIVVSVNNGRVNANYSYWGAPTGPAGGVNTQDAFGDGDQVSLTNSDDATVYPFLTEETGSLISDSQQSGSQLIVLPDPERPIGNANDDNTALVGVANLNGSVGADNPDLFAEGADSPPTAAQSFSGTLSPSNIAQFEVNLSSPGTIDVQGVADGASSNTVQQTYTGQSDNITFSANKSVVSTGSPSEITAQAVDSNGNPVERQGLNVRFAEDSGFNDAGVTLSASDGNTSSNGTATAIVQDDAGSLSPGQEFTVLANIDGNVERANFSTAAGEIDATASTLRLNDSTDDFGNLQVDSTVDVSAEITDANNNPLEGRTVEFSSNGTVEFGSDSVDTNSDGFANTTATVDTETQGVVAINATAGNFNTTSTSSAQRNITTIAGDATQLGFASDSRSMAPGASLNPTVQVQDEFGNFNDTASVNNGISVTSSDTNVISVSGVDDLNSNSDQFTLSAESGGEATITVSSDDSDISGVNDTFVVSDPAAIDLSVAHNVATVSASNSNANTQNQALVTAQFTDSDGSALGVANENISFGLSGSSAELNQSDVTRKSTDGDGNVTILVNGTDTTGTSTIIATAENFTSINRGETTVTTTGSASGISLSPENDTIAQNDEINVTAEFVDDEGRNVPRLTDVSLSADDGNVTTGTTATAPNDDGAVVSTFTYNSSGANDSVTITATGGGLFGETTVTIEEQEPSVSVNFTDQTVPNGTEEVTIDSANFTRADGSAGDYVVVVHTIDEFGAPVGEVSSPIGASDDLTGAEENINVNLTAADGPINNITEDVTLRAMLHTTADDSAFGTRLGNAIDGIEPGDETDDANITVEDEQTVNVGGEDVPVEFTTENDRGERIVTANNAVAAIEAFLNDDPDVDADTAVSVISAFLDSN